MNQATILSIIQTSILKDMNACGQRVSGKTASYMELSGAKKDGDCGIVQVTNGISKDKGCCNLYKPVPGAGSFKCGECTHVGDKK